MKLGLFLDKFGGRIDDEGVYVNPLLCLFRHGKLYDEQCPSVLQFKRFFIFYKEQLWVDNLVNREWWETKMSHFSPWLLGEIVVPTAMLSRPFQ